jgi:hypothetical protein
MSDEKNTNIYKSGTLDNDSWNDYSFLGKLMIIMGVICLICITIIVIAFTIYSCKVLI